MINDPGIRAEAKRQPKAERENARIQQLEDLYFYLAIPTQHKRSAWAHFGISTVFQINNGSAQHFPRTVWQGAKPAETVRIPICDHRSNKNIHKMQSWALRTAHKIIG
jgi:hypothetical protein